MDATTAWLVLGIFYFAPLLHVLLSPSAGSFRAAPESGCPMGPKLGWLVMVLLLGPIGWLMFMTRKTRRRQPDTIS